MVLKYEDLMARSTGDHQIGYTDTQALLYNLSIGMGRDPLNERELPFVLEEPALRVLPTFASVLNTGNQDILAGADIDHTQVLHGEERLTLWGPFPASARLIASTRVTEVTDKGAGKGATITLATDARLASGELLYTSEHVLFARGDGGFGAPAKSAFKPHTLPLRAPDLTHVTETRPDQALLYRLNGDRNLLHAQADFARRAGFPRPILHGLCSYGIACRALLATVCDHDPARVRSFDVRFTSPVFPGETIHTDIWVDGDIVSFRSRVASRGVTSINNGRCSLTPSAGELKK